MDEREELLNAACEEYSLSLDELKERFGAESVGNHEAVDRIYLLSHTWQTHISEHPAILLDPAAYEKACTVVELIEELYQHMGQKE